MDLKNTKDKEPISASQALDIMHKLSKELGIPFEEVKATEGKKTASLRIIYSRF